MSKRDKYVSIQEPNIINILAQTIKQRTKGNNNINIFCIGTNKYVWDSLGPLTGSMLKSCPQLKNVKIIGTMDNAAHAMNMYERMMEIDKDAFVIAVDACVGTKIKTIGITNNPIEPGKALGKNICKVGDLSVLGTLLSYDELNMFMENEINMNEKHIAEIYMSARIISQSLCKAIAGL